MSKMKLLNEKTKEIADSDKLYCLSRIKETFILLSNSINI